MVDCEDLAPKSGQPRPVTFVQIGAEDLELLAPLWESMRTYYRSIAPELPTYGAEESWARRARQYRELLDDGGMIVAARLGGQPIAYAATRPAQSSAVFAWSERTAEVETLVVASAARGRGVGHMLLDRLRLDLGKRGFDELALHVLATNDSALGFYRSAGFRPYLVMLSDSIPSAG